MSWWQSFGQKMKISPISPRQFCYYPKHGFRVCDPSLDNYYNNLLDGDKVVGGEDAKGDCCWFAKVITPELKGEFITDAAVTENIKNKYL